MKTGNISISPQLKYIIFHIFICFYYFYIIFHIFFLLLCVSVKLNQQGKSSKKPQVPNQEEILRLIAANCLRTKTHSCKDDFTNFMVYLTEQMRLSITGMSEGSVIMTAECTSLEILDGLWEECATGHMNEVAQEFLITVDIIREFGEVKVTVTIDEEEYNACRAYFLQFSGKARLCCHAQKESKLYLLG